MRPLVAECQGTEAGHPGPVLRDDPDRESEVLTALDAAAGDARCDALRPVDLPAAAVILGLLGVQLVWAAAKTATSACP